MPLDHGMLYIVTCVGSTQERGRNISICMVFIKQATLIMWNHFMTAGGQTQQSMVKVYNMNIMWIL